MRCCVNGACAKTGDSSSLGSMNECFAISDLPASTPTGQLTSHFGENNGDKPSCGDKDDACRRAALAGAIAPHVAGDSKRTPPAAATVAAHSGGRTPPRVVQISSVLSERKFLGTSGRPLSVSMPISIEPKPGACGHISESTTCQKLSRLIDRINDRYGRCAIGFGLAGCGKLCCCSGMPPDLDSGAGLEPMNTGQALDFQGQCS
jgi:hypothetical protein